ncbi:hypothetical protein CRUP_018567 [Coryphaenoides rupestris]|nr:hypothetical protein CRUP_018567 [Coryphaenoides rupestris]
MQQLRERCLKTWTTEEETVLTNNNEVDMEEEDDEDEDSRQELSAINELNRLPPLTSPLTPRRQGRERRHSNLNCSFSPNSYRKYQTANSSPAHGSSSTPPTPSKFSPGGGSAESSPYFSRRLYSLTSPLERYQELPGPALRGLVEPLDRPPSTGAEEGGGGEGRRSERPAAG